MNKQLPLDIWHFCSGTPDGKMDFTPSYLCRRAPKRMDRAYDLPYPSYVFHSALDEADYARWTPVSFDIAEHLNALMVQASPRYEEGRLKVCNL